MRNAELVADRLVVQSGSNHSGHRAADLAPWHSSVVQMSASPRVIWPRAWPDWSLHSARSTARCLSGVSGAGREPDAARETAGARRRAIKIKIKKRKKRKSSVFALFGAVRRCSQVFFSPRTIYAEVVGGEGEAQSWRLRVLRCC